MKITPSGKIDFVLCNLFGLLGLMIFPAVATNFQKAFEATIENSRTGGSTHMWSDGKGHMRSETTIAGTNHVSIMDMNAKMNYSINDQMKTITQMPLTVPPGEDTSVQWQAIGSKVIDGHPCQGKRATGKDGMVMEVWTGNDTGCTVLMTANGAPMQKLKSWSGTTPSASLFVLPTGYKTQDMSAIMKNMRNGQFNAADMKKFSQQQH